MPTFWGVPDEIEPGAGWVPIYIPGSAPAIANSTAAQVVTNSMLNVSGQYLVKSTDCELFMNTTTPWTVILPVSPYVQSIGGNTIGASVGQLGRIITVTNLGSPGSVTAADVNYDGVFSGPGYPLNLAGASISLEAQPNTLGGYTWQFRTPPVPFGVSIGPISLVAGAAATTGGFLVPMAGAAAGTYRSLRNLVFQVDQVLTAGGGLFTTETPWTQGVTVSTSAQGNGSYDPPLTVNRLVAPTGTQISALVTWSMAMSAGSTPSPVNGYAYVDFW